MKSTGILLSRMDIDEQNQINEYFLSDEEARTSGAGSARRIKLFQKLSDQVRKTLNWRTLLGSTKALDGSNYS